MKKFFKKAGQVFTGAAAAVTLMAGRVMAAEAGGSSNPAQCGNYGIWQFQAVLSSSSGYTHSTP